MVVRKKAGIANLARRTSFGLVAVLGSFFGARAASAEERNETLYELAKINATLAEPISVPAEVRILLVDVGDDVSSADTVPATVAPANDEGIWAQISGMRSRGT